MRDPVVTNGRTSEDGPATGKKGTVGKRLTCPKRWLGLAKKVGSRSLAWITVVIQGEPCEPKLGDGIYKFFVNLGLSNDGGFKITVAEL
jgi:hypothetical protein